MSNASLDPEISVWLDSPGIDQEAAQLSELVSTLAISKPMIADLVIVSEDPFAVDRDRLLAEPATLKVSWRGDLGRDCHGMVASVEESFDARRGAFSHRVRLVPRVWRLSLRSRLKVHAAASVPDVIRSTMTAAGFEEGLDFECRLRADYPIRDYSIQYRETDLNFLRRLTEHWGISFFWEHSSGRDVVIFADANVFWGPGLTGEPVAFNADGLKQEIFDFRSERRHIPKRYVLRDYNYQYPKVGLQSEIVFEQGLEGEEIEYGANFRNEQEAAILTEARRDEILAHSNLFHGHCAEPSVGVGTLFTLGGHPKWENRRFVVVESNVTVKQTTFMDGQTDRPTHDQAFVAVPAEVDYRPARVTGKPRIDGVLHAIVEPQPKGDYGQVDDQGCYRVRLLVDETVEKGGNPYPVVRLSQPSGGQGYGFHFPLRPGTEVMLSFIEGDPDRPIITGTAPNPNDRTPVASDNHARNVIRTESGNEINFDDTDDGTRIKLSVPFDGTSFQLGAPNDPEDGAILSSNGSFETVTNVSRGSTTSLSTDWSILDGKDSHFILSQAKEPKKTPSGVFGTISKGYTIVDKGAKLVLQVYKGLEKGLDLTTKYYGKAHDLISADVKKVRRAVHGEDRETRKTSAEGRWVASIEHFFGDGSDGGGSPLRARLGLADGQELTVGAIAAMADDPDPDPDLERPPLSDIIAFAVSLERIKEAEAAYLKACGKRTKAVEDEDEVAANAQKEAMDEIGLDRALDDLREKERRLKSAIENATGAESTGWLAADPETGWRTQVLAWATTETVASADPTEPPSLDQEAIEALIDRIRSAPIDRTRSTTVQPPLTPNPAEMLRTTIDRIKTDRAAHKDGNVGHAYYVRQLEESCDFAFDTQTFKTSIKSADGTGIPKQIKTVAEIVRVPSTVIGLIKKGEKAGKKTIDVVSSLIRKVSDTKKAITAGSTTALYATENMTHGQAWMSLRGTGLGGVPISIDEAVARGWRTKFGATSAPTGSDKSPTGLFGLKEALNLSYSGTAAVMGADKRAFVHAPLAVLAGMPNVDFENPEASIAETGGTAAVLGKQLALLSSEQVAEIQSREYVLVSAKHLDVDSKETVRIAVGDVGLTGDPKPHRFLIDDDGITISITKVGKKVTIEAPDGSVEVAAKDVLVTSADTTKIKSRMIVLEAEASIVLKAENVRVEAKESVRLTGKNEVDITAGDWIDDHSYMRMYKKSVTLDSPGSIKLESEAIEAKSYEL